MKAPKRKQSSSGEHRIYGINCCKSLLASRKWQIHQIILKKNGPASRNSAFMEIIASSDVAVKMLDRNSYKHQYGHLRTQGVVTTFYGELTETLPSTWNSKPHICLLALDNVEDPQNLGQVIRTAECSGIDGILLPRHDSCGVTESVLQVSQGAFTTLPVYEVHNLHQSLLILKKEDFWIVGVENSIDAKPWHSINYTGRTVIVMGSEGKGIRSLVLKTCDFLATIPMQGQTTSLNVSAAVSAILFERLRQLSA